MMYEASLFVDHDVFKAVRETAQRAPGLMNTAFKLEVRRFRPVLLEKLQFEPEQPEHPFIWSFDPAAQARARRWWFWAVKAGVVPTENGRYKRSGRRIAGWKLITDYTDEGGVLRVENKEPGVEYVYGERQVPSHSASGWPYAELVLEEQGRVLTERVISIWQTVADPFAGIEG